MLEFQDACRIIGAVLECMELHCTAPNSIEGGKAERKKCIGGAYLLSNKDDTAKHVSITDRTSIALFGHRR